MNAARKIARANVLHRAATKAITGAKMSATERKALEAEFDREQERRWAALRRKP